MYFFETQQNPIGNEVFISEGQSLWPKGEKSSEFTNKNKT